MRLSVCESRPAVLVVGLSTPSSYSGGQSWVQDGRITSYTGNPLFCRLANLARLRKVCKRVTREKGP